MKYLITYDLLTPGQNYRKLVTTISALGPCVNLGSSCWAVKSILTAIQIRNSLANYIDRNDLLFVCPFGSHAELHYKQEVIAWLNN